MNRLYSLFPKQTVPPLRRSLRDMVYLGVSTGFVQFATLVLVMRRLGTSDTGSMEAMDLDRLAVFLITPTLAGLIWLWLHLVWREPGGWTNMGMFPPQRNWLTFSILAGFFALFANIAASRLFSPIFGTPQNPPLLGVPGGESASSLQIVLIFLGVAVLAPVFEEIFFRGIMYRWLRGRWSMQSAAAIAALFHAMLHFQSATIPGLFLVFFLFTYVYERTGTIWAPILAHGVHNTVIFSGILYAASKAAP